MSIKDKLKNLNLSNSKERVAASLRSLKKVGIFALATALFVGGFLLGSRYFETGNSANLKGATVTMSGVCTLLATGEERQPSLIEDEVKINSVSDGGKTILATIRKTREEILCDTSKVSFSSLPLLSKWGITPVAPPELTAAVATKRQDPFWKLLEKKTLVISGSCRGPDGKELPNFVDEKVEVTSTSHAADSTESDMFTIIGIKRSDSQSIICNSKLISYRLFDPATEPKEVVLKDVPIDYVGKIVTIDSLCVPDPKYLKERKIDPKTKKPIGRIPKTFSLLNTPVQVLDYKMDDKKQIIYLEGKIVDRTEPEAYGKKIICDSKREKLVVKYSESATNTSLINKKGEDIQTNEPPSNLEVISEGEDAKVAPPVKPEAEPKVIDENQKLQDTLKELNK